MGDGLKITKDKRHRSSSSLAGGNVEGTRSERKLDIRASIPEVDDQFAIAEARCDELQEKIDLVKGLKRRRKLKKRSMTRVSEPTVAGEPIPFISVRTQPKKKVTQQAARLRRLEVPVNPTRGYLDPATIEQHEMVGQVRGYNQMFRQPQGKQANANRKSAKSRSMSRGHPEGDVYEVDSSTGKADPQEVACGDDEVIADNSDINDSQKYYDNYPGSITVKKKNRDSKKVFGARHRSKDTSSKENNQNQNWSYGKTADYSHEANRSPVHTRRQASMQQSTGTGVSQVEERPVVELFNKSRGSTSPESWQRQPFQRTVAPDYEQKTGRGDSSDNATKQQEDTKTEKKKKGVQRRLKYRGHHYEMPTVSSQMKQAGIRCFYEKRNLSNIPFIVSKSTAPSHNIGVNIQQVLNGMKIQQPLSGIPLTMAHHMGLGHIPSNAPRSAAMVLSLDNREMNAIRVGRRFVRLPSYKRMAMPYNRLLHMYSEGEGMVPRFLRAISRPNYIYTSMYNSLTRNRDDATSKGHSESQETKQSLAVYARLFREYEMISKSLKEKPDLELERRRDELVKELTARAEHIGKVVDEQEKLVEPLLRASASNDEEFRHSSFKDFYMIPEDSRQQ